MVCACVNIDVCMHGVSDDRADGIISVWVRWLHDVWADGIITVWVRWLHIWVDKCIGKMAM